jgi:hypothetical protein
MKDLAAVVTEVFKAHHKSEIVDKCICGDAFPCNISRLALDWQRQRADLTRSFRNRTGQELFTLRKYACAMCSEKDTGLICVDCIAEAEAEGETDGSTND